jgi:hypothetical protein
MHTYYILIDGYDAAPEVVGKITANRRRDAEARLARRSHYSEQGLCWLVHSSNLPSNASHQEGEVR